MSVVTVGDLFSFFFLWGSFFVCLFFQGWEGGECTDLTFFSNTSDAISLSSLSFFVV